MNGIRELDDATHEQITDLCEEGNTLAETGELAGALSVYKRALELVPKPLTDWEAATWILTALGDVYFHLGKFEEARNSLLQALLCPDAVGNPFIHLRLGQSQLQLGEVDRAKDELARAYMGGGDEIFEGEDPVYLEYIKKRLRPREDS